MPHQTVDHFPVARVDHVPVTYDCVVDAMVIQQRAHGSGIGSGDGSHGLQNPQRAQGDVVGVAERDRDEVESRHDLSFQLLAISFQHALRCGRAEIMPGV